MVCFLCCQLKVVSGILTVDDGLLNVITVEGGSLSNIIIGSGFLSMMLLWRPITSECTEEGLFMCTRSHFQLKCLNKSQLNSKHQVNQMESAKC